MRQHLKLSIFLFIGILAAGCGGKDETLISGKTMGTTYHVKVVTGAFQGISDLREQIEKTLEAINQSMSTYRKDSEISQFNTLISTEEKFQVSKDFSEVMRVAEKLHQLTNGAWDGTINPLIRLWGFRGSEVQQSIPKAEAIQEVLAEIGFDQIEISDGHLRKKKASVSLDLASIAKGYGVDQVAAVIGKNGFRDFLVEIGGEVCASGFRKDGKPWKIGINTPWKDASLHEVYKALDLTTHKALATSGDYRNFFELNGKRYSHILDPTTGYPLANGVVSASVMADTCTFADGLATALMVLGHEKGIPLVNSLERVECLIVVQAADGTFRDYASEGFDKGS